MRSFVRLMLAALAVAALWATLVVVGSLQGWGHARLAPPDDARAFVEAATEYIRTNHRGNIGFTLLVDGHPYDGYFDSPGAPVDANTRFQVASLSKWVTAWGVMALVDADRLDLDAPIGKYLKRWRLPDSEYGNDGVTARRLLSHTAGLTDGLGYAGFPPGADPQSIEASLTQAADASPGANGRVRVGIPPGSRWEYSGGGYTLLQLLIEEISGVPFETYMEATVLQPLGMNRSTFLLAGNPSADVAEFYDADGRPATHYRFTSLAATSLYTTTADLTRFLQAHLASPDGTPPGRGVLKPATVDQMRKPHATKFGADIWGLGVMLFAPNNRGGFIIGHDGSNEPAINTTARLDPATGDGIVILETGNPLLATRLAGEWVFWHTGNIDFLLVTMNASKMGKIVVGGWIVVLLATIVWGWRTRSRPARANRAGSKSAPEERYGPSGPVDDANQAT